MNARTPGEYWNSEKRICSAVKYLTERTSAAASSRGGPSCSVRTAGGVAVAVSKERGRFAILRAVLQSLSNARTPIDHPAAWSFCARRAIAIEWPPDSANSSSIPIGVSNTVLQISSTS
jgi:hypothetical protein